MWELWFFGYLDLFANGKLFMTSNYRILKFRLYQIMSKRLFFRMSHWLSFHFCKPFCAFFCWWISVTCTFIFKSFLVHADIVPWYPSDTSIYSWYYSDLFWDSTLYYILYTTVYCFWTVLCTYILITEISYQCDRFFELLVTQYCPCMNCNRH